MRVRAGQRIDRYELIEPLGAGGQGSVWKAKDLLENGPVRAVKLIARERVSADDFERARREAHTLARTVHPALIGCHGVFDDVRVGIGGIVLDFVDGVPLSDVLHDQRLSMAHRYGLLAQLIDALAFVHERNIVHRDLKPDNILLTNVFWNSPTTPGTVKLIDFGISVELGNPRPLTATGAVFGTAPYLAPELLAGDLAVGNHGVDSADGFARDMFAFGVLGAELLLGRHPTGLPLDAPRERFAQVYREIARGVRPWPPTELTGPSTNAIRACLSISVHGRPRSGSDLLRVAKGGAIAAAPTDLAMSTAPPKERTTEPMPYAASMVQPHHPRVPVQQPVYHRPPPLPAPEWIPPPPPSTIPIQSNKGLLAMFFAGILVAGVAFYFATRSNAEPSDAVLTISPQSTTASKLLQPDATAPSLPAPPATPALTTRPAFPLPGENALSCGARCCGGTNCEPSSYNIGNEYVTCNVSNRNCDSCPSERKCVPGACADYLDPNATWSVRLAGVSRDEKNVGSVPSDTKVCLRRSSPFATLNWSCTYAMYSATEKGVFVGAPITTNDLHENGIDIELRDVRDRRLASRQWVKFPGKVHVTALCKGLVLREIVSESGDKYLVRVYLDDSPTK